MRYAVYKPLHTGLQDTKFRSLFQRLRLVTSSLYHYMLVSSQQLCLDPRCYMWCMCCSVICKHEVLYAMYYIYTHTYIYVIMRHEGVDA